MDQAAVTCPKCQQMRLIEGACVGCGYGFKPVRKKRRVKKQPKPAPKVEPWWAR